MPARSDRLVEKEADQRDPYQRDRDRILYSSAFRRLAGVTQVVSPGEGEVFHNRLTHTLKVAQVARRLAEMFLGQPQGKQKAEGWGEISPDVVEAAALAHDLGHPPFGHIAEKELDRLVAEDSGTEGYEGNAQSFRIITKLSVQREGEKKGLELTRATLNATLKYPCLWSSDLPKWGAYRTEQEEFEFARELSKRQPNRPCIEAQIMDWADDIAYSVHDTEDFYRAGLIPLDRLAVNPKEREKFLQAAIRRRGEIKKPLPESGDELEKIMDQFFDSVRIEEPYTGTRTQRGQLRQFTSFTISTYLQGTTLLEFPGTSGKGLEVPPVFNIQVALLKELTWYYVINNPALAALQCGQRQAIKTLFEIYQAAADQKQWSMFPARFRDDVIELANQHGGKLPSHLQSRLTADTIASMTDQQAFQMYHRMTGQSQSQSFDPILT